MRFLRETPPLVGTLGDSHAEYAAALTLYGLHILARPWSEPLTARELFKVLRDACDREPIRSWGRNPFLRPDWDELVARGFALRVETNDGDVWRLTPAALQRVAAHLTEHPCRRCVECRGQEHHWLTSMPECPEDGEPFIPCKHCPARAAVCESCCEAPVFPRVSDQPLCVDCRETDGS